MYVITVCLCLMGCVLTAPANDSVPLEKQQPTVIPIVSQSEELEPNGTYKYSYETGNGIKREEISYDKIVPKAKNRAADSNEGGESDESDEIHVQQGSYSYVAPDGTVISVRYIADENGFQPIGDHIPRIAAPEQISSLSGVYTKDVDNSEAGTSLVSSKVVAESTQVKLAPLETSQTYIGSRSGNVSSKILSMKKNSSESSKLSVEKHSTTEALSESSTTDAITEEISTTELSTTTVSDDLSSTTNSSTTTDLSTTSDLSTTINLSTTTEILSTTEVTATEGNVKESTVTQDKEKSSKSLTIESSSPTPSPSSPNPSSSVA